MLDLKNLYTTKRTMSLEYHDVLEIARKKMNMNDDMYVCNLERVRNLLKPDSLARIVKDYADNNPGGNRKSSTHFNTPFGYPPKFLCMLSDPETYLFRWTCRT